MANPKLLVPGPQRRPYVGGLLAVANVVDITDPHAAMGVQYDFNQCAMPVPAPGLCWSSVDPGGTKDNVIAPGVQDAPITGAIYAAAQCYAYDTRQGEADYEAQARDLLMGGESFAMERVFFDQYLDGATSFPAIDASLVGAIGTAEQVLGARYPGGGIIHMNRYLANQAASEYLLLPTGTTVQGTEVANGAGYIANADESSLPTGTELTTIYATGLVTIWRGPIEVHVVTEPTTNTTLAIAERTFSMAVDCYGTAITFDTP